MSSRKISDGRDAVDEPRRVYSQRPKPTWSRRILSNLLRLSVWFSILTVLFRCPSTLEEVTSDSPRICRPYFQARDAVSPHVRPYYDAYAAPYVELARPYADKAYNTVLLPSYGFVQRNYELYGAPRVETVKVYSQQEWEKAIKPQIEKGRLRISEVYQISLGPHVDAASVKLEPYYANVKNFAGTQYDTIIVPTYEKTRPYAVDTYQRGSRFTTEVGLPYGRWAATNAATFVQRRVWPSIYLLYGENVQPQLVKIRERLANYRESKSIEAAVESEAESMSSSSSSSSSKDSISSNTAGSTESPISAATSSIASAVSSIKPSSTKAPDNVVDELQVWKNKFNRAAEEGADGLRQRISEISKKQTEDQSQGTGEALVTSLEETAKSAISSLKSDVLSIVSSLSSDGEESSADDVEKAKDRARESVRAAGKKVKDNAQKLRAWRKSFNDETQKLTDAAADSTLDVVDSIREAGLQEIGMRWASMEGVTYKDWSEYHAMRKSFDEWRETLQSVVSDHEGPEKARRVAEEVESRGMAIAEDAAKELARLKEVAHWKVDARDSSKDFSTRYTPPGAARVAQQAKEKAQEAVQRETPQGTAESLSSRVGEAAQSVVGEGESATDRAKQKVFSAASPIGDVASSASSRASSATDSVGSGGSSASASASSRASSATDSLASSGSSVSSSGSSRASAVASPVASSASSATDSVASDADSSGSSTSSRASSATRAAASSKSSLSDDASSILSEKAPKSAKDASSSAKSAASSMSGAGTTVPGEGGSDTIVPIASVSASIASVVNEAGGDYASATSSIGRAEEMRMNAGGERESPVEELRRSVSEA